MTDVYRRTLPKRHADETWPDLAQQTAVISTWIQREARREGWDVPTFAAPIIREHDDVYEISISVQPRRPYEGWDVDPRYVEPEPAPVRTDHVHDGNCHHWILWVVLGLAWIVGAVLAALLIAHLARDAAPRSAPDPTAPQPGASVATGSVGAPAQVQVGASGPRPSGAPTSEPGAIERPGQGETSRGSSIVGAPADTRIAGRLDPAIGREGDIAHSGSRTPYVAIPLGPGIRIRVCGPADCLEVTSTDAGPNHDMLVAGRIMDLDIGRWEQVCGVPATFGLCPGSWIRVTGPQLTPPATDVTP